MNPALRGTGARYDVRPAMEQGSPWGGPLTGIAAMGKDACQGACAGFLSLIGATHLTSGPSVFGELTSANGMFDQVWSALAANGMSGPIELLGGIALFFAARRTVSRTIGLVAFIAFVAAYANGYTLADIAGVASTLLESVAGALDAIPAAESSV